MDARAARPQRAYAEPALEVEGLGRAAFALFGNLAPYTYAGRIGDRPHPPLTPGRGSTSSRRSLFRFAPFRGSPRTSCAAAAPTARDVLYSHDLERLVVRCDRPLPLQVDGEDLGDVTEVLVESERDALTVLV